MYFIIDFAPRTEYFKSMKLHNYIQNNSVESLAGKAKVSVSAIYNYASGYRRPRPEIALRLVKATGGKVTLEDLYTVPRKEAA